MSDEINKIMAVEIMGYELVSGCDKRITASPDLEYYVRPEHDPKPGERSFHKDYIVCLRGLWKPTIWIDQAIECLEKYSNDSHLSFDFHYESHPCSGSGYIVQIKGRDPYKVNPVLVTGEPLALAICKAILMSKGISV